MIRALTFALMTLAGGAWADTDPTHIARRASGMLEAAANSLQAAETARDRVAALTQTIEAYEEGLSALRSSLRGAASRENTLRAVFEAKRDEISQLVGTLSSIERPSGPLLLLHPSGPVGTARSGMMLSEITPGLQVQAEQLRAALEEVSLLKTLQQSATDSMSEGLKGVQEARRLLSQAMADRTTLPENYAEGGDAMRQLLETSDTLESFASGLGSLPAERAGLLDFRFQKGRVDPPVSGRLLRAFNETDAAGIQRPGWVMATAPGALVTVPAASTIRYVGPLLDFGNVVVLEPADDILLVIAGMQDVFGSPGQVVPEGTPLGLMPHQSAENALQTAEFGAPRAEVSGGDRSETLYIELRVGQSPEDPANWFAATNDG
jgi:septal ring factor EnvC (AmiA/AmiB activator)